MPRKSPSYQWYPDKWLADTRRLSWKAKGLYKDLLDIIWMQYQEVCSIPDDADFIAGEMGCTPQEWVEARAEIMLEHRPLMKLITNRLFSNGLWKEHIKQRVRREKLAENGRKGGRPKTKRLISDNLNERLPSPIPIPIPIPAPAPALENKALGVGGDPPAPTGILDLVQQIKDCRPEFRVLNQMAIENELKAVPIKDAQSAVRDWCRDMANAVNIPNMPLKLLAGYLRKAFDGPGTQPKIRNRLT